MLKKSISVILTLLMIVGIFTIIPVTVSAQTTYESGDYSYVLVTKNDVSVAEITVYSGSDADLTIPDTLDGYTVNAVRREAFRRKTFLTSVTFPDSVTFIADCTNLASVKLPENLEDLARASFYNCTALEEITLPATITKCYANSGTWMTFRGPFNGCSNLNTVNFEEGFTTIPDYLFEGCTGLTAMDIPDTVTTIGECAFEHCTSLSAIDLPDTLTVIDRGAFSYSDIESVTLPDTVTTIEYDAFRGCGSLTYADIGSGVTALENDTFRSCPKLETFICRSDDLVFSRYTFHDDDQATFYGMSCATSYYSGVRDYCQRPYIWLDEPVLGDVDDDGDINIVDATLILRQNAFIETPQKPPT